MTVYPLAALPRLQLVEPPSLSPTSQVAVEAARARIAADRNTFNGPKLLTLDATPEVIAVYETDYSFRLAHADLAVDGRSPLGIGSLACAAALFAPDGQVLLARRSATVAISPSRWALPVTGGVSPGETPPDAIQREIEEELGIADTTPTIAGLCVGPEPVGCTLLYTVVLPDRVEFTEPNHEASVLRWFPAGSHPTPAVPYLAEMINAAARVAPSHA